MRAFCLIVTNFHVCSWFGLLFFNRSLKFAYVLTVGTAGREHVAKGGSGKGRGCFVLFWFACLVLFLVLGEDAFGLHFFYFLLNLFGIV